MPKNIAIYNETPTHHFLQNRLFGPSSHQRIGDNLNAPYVAPHDYFEAKGVNYYLQGQQKSVYAESVALATSPIFNAHILLNTGIKNALIGTYLHELTDILQHRDHYSYSIGVGIGGENAVFLSELAPAIKPGNIVCDLIDSIYLLRKRSPRTLFKKINLITMLKDRKTKLWEKYLSHNFTCLYISKEDASASNSDAAIIPNCVVDDDYEIAEPVQLASPNIGCVGNMGYKPNIEACDFLFDKIYPALLKKRPDTYLYVIGRNPSESLLKRNQHPNIHITGDVDNVWSYIKSIDVFVFPIISGTGLQNKVLEAMHAKKTWYVLPLPMKA